MNAVGVLVGLFFMLVCFVLFLYGVNWLSKRFNDPNPPDNLVHFMKLNSTRAHCGKPRAEVTESFDNWAKVTCPECLHFRGRI